MLILFIPALNKDAATSVVVISAGVFEPRGNVS